MALIAAPLVRAETASPDQADDWSVRKCELYYAAWKDALEFQGNNGLSPGFLDQHDAFFAANCAHDMRICARSKEEIALADLLTIMSINEGMASNFVPFGCPAQ